MFSKFFLFCPHPLGMMVPTAELPVLPTGRPNASVPSCVLQMMILFICPRMVCPFFPSSMTLMTHICHLIYYSSVKMMRICDCFVCLLEGSVLLYVLKSVVYLAGLHRIHCIMKKHQRDKESCKTIICVQADMPQEPG